MITMQRAIQIYAGIDSFRELNRIERSIYADAPLGAVIAYVPDEEMITVISSNDYVEFHGENNWCVSLNFSILIDE